jgi:hypothetical protein
MIERKRAAHGVKGSGTRAVPPQLLAITCTRGWDVTDLVSNGEMHERLVQLSVRVSNSAGVNDASESNLFLLIGFVHSPCPWRCPHDHHRREHTQSRGPKEKGKRKRKDWRKKARKATPPR